MKNTLRFFGAAVLVAAIAVGQAATTSIIYTDAAGEGFNDPTFGTQRKTAFENAVAIWANQLVSPVTIVISAHFDPLGGTATSAILGQAGPNEIFANFTNAPLTNTWYSSALANAKRGSDLSGQADIDATFNSDVDGATVLGSTSFYYGVDSNPGSNVDFRSVALHELGHGLGFVDLIDSATGAFPSDLPDIYSRQLARSPSSSPSDPSLVNVDTMSNANRLAAITSGQLYWKGANVLAAKSNTLVKMYAPSPYESGSSVSHWDVSNTPDLLMEPFDTGPKSSVDLTKQAFQDMGWTFTAAGVDDWELF